MAHKRKQITEAFIDIEDLNGTALDWAVAKSLGELERIVKVGTANANAVVYDPQSKMMFSMCGGLTYAPSIQWDRGGVLLERFNIEVTNVAVTRGAIAEESSASDDTWMASIVGADGLTSQQFGCSYLQAAMRCLVDSKLGYYVKVPNFISNSRYTCTPILN